MLVFTCCVAFASSLVDESEQCDSWCHTGGEARSLCGLMEGDLRQSRVIDLFCAETATRFLILSLCEKDFIHCLRVFCTQEDHDQRC